MNRLDNIAARAVHHVDGALTRAEVAALVRLAVACRDRKALLDDIDNRCHLMNDEARQASANADDESEQECNAALAALTSEEPA